MQQEELHLDSVRVKLRVFWIAVAAIVGGIVMALDPIVGGIVAGVLFLVAVFYRRGTLIAPHRVAIGTGIGVPFVETPVSLAGVTRVALVTTSEVSYFWQDSIAPAYFELERRTLSRGPSAQQAHPEPHRHVGCLFVEPVAVCALDFAVDASPAAAP